MSEGRVEWSEFAQRLTRELIQLPVEAFVIVQAPVSRQFKRSSTEVSHEGYAKGFHPH